MHVLVFYPWEASVLVQSKMSMDNGDTNIIHWWSKTESNNYTRLSASCHPNSSSWPVLLSVHLRRFRFSVFFPKMYHKLCNILTEVLTAWYKACCSQGKSFCISVFFICKMKTIAQIYPIDNFTCQLVMRIMRRLSRSWEDKNCRDTHAQMNLVLDTRMFILSYRPMN